MKCYYCKNTADVGKKTCTKHTEEKRESAQKQRTKRKKLGICSMCGGEIELEQYTQCNKCRRIQKENYISRRAVRLENNLCTLCARDKSIVQFWTNTRCPGCHFREKFGWKGSKEEAEKIINDLLNKQNYECALTGRDIRTNKFHIDHIIPRSVDPNKVADPDNWQLIVEDANFFKKDKCTEDVFSVAIDMVKYAIKRGVLSVSDIASK